MYSKYGSADVVVEFKYALASLFRDFDDEVKLFDEIDIVVVWEITERDHEVVKTRVEEGLTTETSSLFHYKLFLGRRDRFVLCACASCSRMGLDVGGRALVPPSWEPLAAE